MRNVIAQTNKWSYLSSVYWMNTHRNHVRLSICLPFFFSLFGQYCWVVKKLRESCPLLLSELYTNYTVWNVFRLVNFEMLRLQPDFDHSKAMNCFRRNNKTHTWIRGEKKNTFSSKQLKWSKFGVWSIERNHHNEWHQKTGEWWANMFQSRKKIQISSSSSWSKIPFVCLSSVWECMRVRYFCLPILSLVSIALWKIESNRVCLLNGQRSLFVTIVKIWSLVFFFSYSFKSHNFMHESRQFGRMKIYSVI